MKKKILFLGGAFSQVPAITYAKNNGMHVITLDYLPDNPGHKISDEYFNVSTVDKDQVLEICQRLKIDAISSYASDPSALTAAYVSSKMSLVGNVYESVETLSDKGKFRQFLKQNKFNSPWYFTAKAIEEVSEKYPGGSAIVKPVDSSGSKGVYIINNLNELKEVFNIALNYSKKQELIIEQFIEKKGPQIHGEGFVKNGILEFVLLGDQIFSPVNELIPYSTTVPSLFHINFMDEIEDLIQDVILKVGFKTGGINIEVIRDVNDKLYVLEIGARNGGNFMPQLEYYATEYDLVKANIDALLNKETAQPFNIPKQKYYSQVILHSTQNGKYKGVNIPKRFEDNLKFSAIYPNIGENIYKYRNSADVIGVLIFELKSKNEYLDFADVLKKNEWI